MQLVAPMGHVRGASIGALFGKNLTVLRAGLFKVILDSFRARGMRDPKDSDVKERIDFCIGIAAELQFAHHWSVERIVDEMSAILKAKLDGTPWEPSKRASWAATSFSS